MMETNTILLHELRTRKGVSTFQQARRVERLVSSSEIQSLKIDARLNPAELRVAVAHLLSGLTGLMSELVPRWRAADVVLELLKKAGLPSMRK